MQTFLPYDDFEQTALCLDDARLKNQRNECKAIIRSLIGRDVPGWSRHPATKQWQGYIPILAIYATTICDECRRRGYPHYDYDGIDCCKWFGIFFTPGIEYELPWWIGYEPYHKSHRSNLLRKKPEHYRLCWRKLSDSEPYVWPSKIDQPNDLLDSDFAK